MRGWCGIVAVALAGCAAGHGEPATFRGGPDVRVLAFSHTEGFRHGSIPAAIATVEGIAADAGWTVDATEDPTAFTAANLATYDAVAWLLTTGDVLDAGQEAAFEAFIQGGGGYVGVHSASDTEYDWAWYGGLVGAYFDGHPAPQDATVQVVDGTHGSTQHLPIDWMRFDEWYNFAPNPSESVNVLLNLDETTYSGGTMGADHPIAWYHAYDGGRAFYTAGGHTDESYAEPDFVQHLRGGIEYAVGGGDPPGSSSSGADSVGASSGSPGSSGAGPQSGGGDDAAPSDSTGPPRETSGSTGADGSAPAEAASGGCGCRSDGAPPWLLITLLLVVRRRLNRSRLSHVSVPMATSPWRGEGVR